MIGLFELARALLHPRLELFVQLAQGFLRLPPRRDIAQQEENVRAAVQLEGGDIHLDLQFRAVAPAASGQVIARGRLAALALLGVGADPFALVLDHQLRDGRADQLGRRLTTVEPDQRRVDHEQQAIARDADGIEGVLKDCAEFNLLLLHGQLGLLALRDVLADARDAIHPAPVVAQWKRPIPHPARRSVRAHDAIFAQGFLAGVLRRDLALHRRTVLGMDRFDE